MNAVGLTRRQAVALMGLAAGANRVSAQEWPDRTIRFIVPTAPGGPTDMVGRQLAERLAVLLKQPVVVDNRPGAGHVIGMAAVAQAAAGGATWGLVTTPLVVAPALNPKLPFDPQRDLVPVSLLAAQPLVLVSGSKTPLRTAAELVAYAKRHPRELNMASAGNATGPHLAGELFASMAGIQVTHVPYKGGPQATTAVLAGEADFYFDTPSAAIPHIRSGKLSALAVTSKGRSGAMPDVPTVAEQGLPGYEFISWTGLVAPRGTPRAVLERMQAEVVRAISSPELQARLGAVGMDVVASSQEEFAQFIAAELSKWKKVVVDARITAD